LKFHILIGLVVLIARAVVAEVAGGGVAGACERLGREVGTTTDAVGAAEGRVGKGGEARCRRSGGVIAIAAA